MDTTPTIEKSKVPIILCSEFVPQEFFIKLLSY